MTDVRFLQLDVFCAHPGGGNPLGVVIGAADWPDARLQAFATWVDLVETTFLLPSRSAQADYRLRIFTPQREIAFAGHPTIGSAHAALYTGFASAPAGRLTQECGAGLLPIQLHPREHGHDLFVQAPSARVLAEGIHAHALLAPAVAGTALGRMGPAFVEGGRRWWIAQVQDEASLRAWRPDHAAIGALARATDSLGLAAFAVASAAPYDLAVRAFPAGVGIVEDPASGAANGMIAAYLAHADPHGPWRRGYCVSQGREIGRDATIDIRYADADAVWVGGRSHVIIDGQLRWP